MKTPEKQHKETVFRTVKSLLLLVDQIPNFIREMPPGMPAAKIADAVEQKIHKGLTEIGDAVTT